MGKQKPKCVVEFSYCCDDYDCDCENCVAFEDAGCSANPEFWPDHFTTEEKVAALMDKAKELPKEIVVPALRAALEELTDMRWVMIDKQEMDRDKMTRLKVLRNSSL